MVRRNDKEELKIRLKESFNESPVSRRTFLQILGATSMLGVVRDAKGTSPSDVSFTIVNHWHQSGVGWLFREGKVGEKHYQQAFSVFYGVQKTIDAARQFPWLTICLEFDSHAYEVIQGEDKQFVQEKFRPLVAAGRIEPVGGTYSQPYVQLVGWQSNVRQFVEGRAVVREVLGKEVECFLVEEIIFHPQMPQLLRLCGYPYASLQVQNNGSLPLVKKAVVNWQGLDGSAIPTIPYNPWLISLVKQNQSLAGYVDPAAEAEEALLTIWAEIWPPGLDWGASYTPYTEGLQSLRNKGLQSLGFGEYMRRRCKPGTNLESQYWKMDDPVFNFGWPQNKESLWGTLGGWGYEGDALLKENRRLEHELNAAEILLSSAPDSGRSKRLRDLWKQLMRPQNHDCFIVGGFESEYEHVLTTNLEVAKMMSSEVEAGVRQLRQEAAEHLAGAPAAESSASVICQNPAGVAVRQPIALEMGPSDGYGYFLESGGAKVELQRIESVYANENPRLVGVVDLPPCGFKTFGLRKGPAASVPSLRQSGEIANEYYSVKWDESRKGFVILDRDKSRTVLFRPFSGEITHVNESGWKAPNSGAKFRAKDFGEVTYSSAIEAAGPAYHALAVRGDLLTLSTTEEPAAWVTARAVLYQGIRRVDIITELHTYPQIKFLALSELEFAADQTKAVRDFPFGEEESHNEQFSALNYVRLQSPGFAMILAHGGTQQFFCVRTPGRVLLRNMIAHGTLKGSYRWNWSVTTGSSFTAAESFRFAEASWGPIVQRGTVPRVPSQSWVSVNDPAIVIFRLGADSERLTVWLMNYSDEHKQGELSFTVPLRACRRVNLEGNPMMGVSAVLDESAKSVKLNLSPWEIAALDLECR
jgi:hypothetical protein